MDVHENDVVMPGDRAVDIDKIQDSSKVILGPGLRRFEGKVLVTKCGILKQKGKVTFWIENQQKRYVPARDELVIGMVVNKAGDYFKVDIGSSEHASLSYLSFEGATKKNRPNINVGDALYTKILSANKDMEPELVCVDSNWKKGVTGLLDPSGFLFSCSINLIQICLENTHEVLNKLGTVIPFEVAVGLNGRIWIKAKNTRNCLAIVNTLLKLEQMEYNDLGNKCVDILRQQLTQL